MGPLPVYALTMTPADLQWFQRHAGTDRCFPAELQVGAGRWPVWIGYRGRYTRKFPKYSYDLWFSPDQTFHGQQRLHLNAAYRDPSRVRNRLALAVFADLGVPTPRAWHVWLTLNGEPLGLYTAVESLDAGWMQRRRLAPGAIYYAVGGAGNFGLLDPWRRQPKDRLARGYEKCYPGDDDFSDLEALILTIGLAPPAEFARRIDAILDVEACLRWLVGVVFIGHTDGLVHNYALFRPEGGRWQISPWDCDGTWGRFVDGSRAPARHMPLHGDGENYLCVRLLATPPWRRRYLDLWEELLPTALAPERLTARVAALLGEVRAAARREPMASRRFPWEADRIGRYVRARTRFIRREVAAWRANPRLPWPPAAPG